MPGESLAGSIPAASTNALWGRDWTIGRRQRTDSSLVVEAILQDAWPVGSFPFSAEGFSGVVRIGDEAWVFGYADRAHAVPNTVDTQFAIASGAKGFTAIVAGTTLSLDLRARELLGDDLPLVDERVTVGHLLRHTSGIGDYLDEEVGNDRDAYVMPVPVHELATTEDYVKVLDGL